MNTICILENENVAIRKFHKGNMKLIDPPDEKKAEKYAKSI